MQDDDKALVEISSPSKALQPLHSATDTTEMAITPQGNFTPKKNMASEAALLGLSVDLRNNIVRFNEEAVKASEDARKKGDMIFQQNIGKEGLDWQDQIKLGLQTSTMASRAQLQVAEHQAEAMMTISKGCLQVLTDISAGMDKVVADFMKSSAAVIEAEKKELELEEAKWRNKLAEIRAKAKDEEDALERQHEIDEKHKDKLEEIETKAREKKWALEEKRMDAEMKLLEKKDKIDNRVLQEDFAVQVKLYEQQLQDARNEIARVANKKSYHLTYNPPKIVEEGGKKVVKPGFVEYRIN